MSKIPRMIGRYVVTVCLVSSPLAIFSCSSSGFECGTPLASDLEQTYTCSRPEEVCVCDTRSCARIEHPGSQVSVASATTKPCESGLRYVLEEEFVADHTLAGKCVDPAHASSKIDQPDIQSRCPGSPPLPASTGGSTSVSTAVSAGLGSDSNSGPGPTSGSGSTSEPEISTSVTLGSSTGATDSTT